MRIPYIAICYGSFIDRFLCSDYVATIVSVIISISVLVVFVVFVMLMVLVVFLMVLVVFLAVFVVLLVVFPILVVLIVLAVSVVVVWAVVARAAVVFRIFHVDVVYVCPVSPTDGTVEVIRLAEPSPLLWREYAP